VKIYGLETGAVKELAGAGQTWRMWSVSGHGYQSGREWKYGQSSIWIVQVDGDNMLADIGFELGHKWKAGRKIIAQIVEQLNQNPGANHLPYLIELSKKVRDWHCEQQELTPIQRLEKAIKTIKNE
jgi:hypothetical protein